MGQAVARVTYVLNKMGFVSHVVILLLVFKKSRLPYPEAKPETLNPSRLFLLDFGFACRLGRGWVPYLCRASSCSSAHGRVVARSSLVIALSPKP